MTHEELAEIVREEVAALSPVDRLIEPGDSLLMDLGLDSLGGVELLLALEERCEVDIDEGTLEEWTTVGDITATLARSLGLPEDDALTIGGG